MGLFGMRQLPGSRSLVNLRCFSKMRSIMALLVPAKSQLQKRLTVIPLMDVLSDFTEEHIILGVSLYASRHVKAILLPGTQLNWLRDILSVCQVFIA